MRRGGEGGGGEAAGLTTFFALTFIFLNIGASFSSSVGGADDSEESESSMLMDCVVHAKVEGASSSRCGPAVVSKPTFVTKPQGTVTAQSRAHDSDVAQSPSRHDRQYRLSMNDIILDCPRSLQFRNVHPCNYIASTYPARSKTRSLAFIHIGCVCTTLVARYTAILSLFEGLRPRVTYRSVAQPDIL